MAEQAIQSNTPVKGETNQPVEQSKVVEKKDKKWIVALLLSIILGGLGIDRFYMGYIWQGILKLITLGGFGIWALIDIIMIAIKHDYAKVNWVE